VSAAREEILARVRAALDGTAPPVAPPRAYRREGALTSSARVELLVDRLSDYRAQVHRAAEADIPRIAAGRFGIPRGLPEAWRPERAVVDDGLSALELDSLDGVLTGCTVAVAETGTIVLAGGPAEGRRALTLVPDLHVCVVREEQVVETVPEAFERLRGLERRPLTFVSGPSATSDIELKRVEGVHGPRNLVVVLVAGRSATELGARGHVDAVAVATRD
jgi:L-lactate dehydrogenase complex protein LldG